MASNVRALGLEGVSKFETSPTTHSISPQVFNRNDVLEKENAATAASYTGSPSTNFPTPEAMQRFARPTSEEIRTILRFGSVMA